MFCEVPTRLSSSMVLNVGAGPDGGTRQYFGGQGQDMHPLAEYKEQQIHDSIKIR